MRKLSVVVLCLLTIAAFSAVNAQPPGGFGGRDRGEGRGGDRGGFGGDRGGFGGDRGGFRGGFGGPPGFGGGPPPGGGRSMMDRNGDGRIDQSEIDQIPSGFRQMLESRGMQFRPGMSVDDLRNSMRAQFEQMRQEGGGFPSGGRPGTDNNAPGNRTPYTPSESFRPREKERMTVDLPPKYSELDIDYDGQIGLYEWITARRESLDQFDQIDTDFDGLLTPQELLEFDELAASAEPQVAAFAEKYERSRLTIVGADGSSGGEDGRIGKNGKTKLTKEEKQRHEESATRFFGFMDRDRDGKISTEEFANSRRLRPMFEQAGIKIEDMSQSEFVKKYVKAMEKTGGQSQGDSRGGDRNGGDRSGGSRFGGGGFPSGAPSGGFPSGGRGGFGGDRSGFSGGRGGFGR